MLRILFPLISGIAGEMWVDELSSSLIGLKISIVAVFVSLILISAYSFLTSTSQAYQYRVVNGGALILLLFSLGYIDTWLATGKNQPRHFSKFYRGGGDIVVAKVVEPPVEKEKLVTAVAEVTTLKSGNTVAPATGNVQLNFWKDKGDSVDIHYGDVIAFSREIQEFDPPKNPNEFRFKRYYALRNIYHKVFLNGDDWHLLKTDEGNNLFAGVLKVRASFLATIKKYVSDKNDFGVAAAIMLGYNDFENNDIKRAYASSGTLHVLSVSGLHVGIMFLMLNFLLKWMDERGRRFVIAKATFIILFIWFYAVLTGLSAPVIRSAMMFTLIQIGTVMARNVNTYNIVAGSAVLILLFNPFLIADVGFQLSYMAVFGIVYFYKKISVLLVFKLPSKYKSANQKGSLSKLNTFVKHHLRWLPVMAIDFCWQLIAVSIAAQVVTLPLSLLYFNQFPKLFLLSNLVVIPLSNLVLFIGTALFAFGHIPFLNDCAGALFNWLLHVLDKFVFAIDRLPFALIQGIVITTAELVLLYLLIGLIAWLTEQQKPKVLIAALGIFVALCSFQSYRNYTNSGLKEIVVYDVPKKKAVAFISSCKVQYDIDSSLLSNYGSMNFYIRHHWWNCGVTNASKISGIPTPYGDLVVFEGHRILLVDSAGEHSNYGIPLKADILVMSENIRTTIAQMSQKIHFDEVVFDSSNKPWRTKKWINECKSIGLRYWDVATQGAYIKHLE